MIDYNDFKKKGWKISFKHQRRYVPRPLLRLKLSHSLELSNLGGTTTCTLQGPPDIYGDHKPVSATHVCPDTARFVKKQNCKAAFYQALHRMGCLELIKHGNHL